tara:strand:- start:72 stop:197 length:126 start_codon:yes stop_codon:yes gene_type:complete
VKSTKIEIKIEKYIKEIDSTLIIKIVIIGKKIAAIIAPRET